MRVNVFRSERGERNLNALQFQLWVLRPSCLRLLVHTATVHTLLWSQP